MEQVVHEIGNNSEACIRGGIVAVRGEFTGLEATECPALFRVEIGAVGIEPVN